MLLYEYRERGSKSSGRVAYSVMTASAGCGFCISDRRNRADSNRDIPRGVRRRRGAYVLRAREARIVPRDGVAQRQPVLVGQHQEQRACELLRHRADGEHRAGRHGVVGRTIPHAVSLCEDDAAVAHDADGEPDDPFLSDGSTHDAVDLRRRDLLRSHRPREPGRRSATTTAARIADHLAIAREATRAISGVTLETAPARPESPRRLPRAESIR